MLARGEDGYDRFGAGDGFGGRYGTGTAGIGGARKRLFAEVESTDLMPRLRQIRGHPAAHVSESDKGDFHIFSPPACGRGRGRACPVNCTGGEETAPPLPPTGRTAVRERRVPQLENTGGAA